MVVPKEASKSQDASQNWEFGTLTSSTVPKKRFWDYTHQHTGLHLSQGRTSGRLVPWTRVPKVYFWHSMHPAVQHGPGACRLATVSCCCPCRAPGRCWCCTGLQAGSVGFVGRLCALRSCHGMPMPAEHACRIWTGEHRLPAALGVCFCRRLAVKAACGRAHVVASAACFSFDPRSDGCGLAFAHTQPVLLLLRALETIGRSQDECRMRLGAQSPNAGCAGWLCVNASVTDERGVAVQHNAAAIHQQLCPHGSKLCDAAGA